ncbi:MAG: MFS transporter [Christensenellaceae bacterium]|nr:MFS transporter [Christensenellaceae bacterium]
MASILIAIIYLAFVSMGLPDALLGSAWPSIYGGMGVPVSWAGLVTIIMAGGTVVSSLLSDRLLRRFGTGLVTAVSTLMTAVALFGFSVSGAFWHLILWAIPYGLGAGSIDAALNNYVALKYKSRHMSWIHFFWGVGATAGPVIMGGILSGGAAWTSGYRAVGFLQTAMTLVLFLTLSLWRKNDLPQPGVSDDSSRMTRRQVLRLPGAKALLVAFFCYSSVEATAGLWASSYMTLQRGVPPETAARWASIFYLGITLGRFAIGFITDRVGDRNMIRIGQGCIILGVLTMLIPGSNTVSFAGLILAGLGCAPVYPCLLHETPVNFGAENSQTMMGFQMACAYTGSTLMPPLFGLIAGHVSIGLYPVYLLLFAVTMLLTAERMNRAGRK